MSEEIGESTMSSRQWVVEFGMHRRVLKEGAMVLTAGFVEV